MFEPVVHWVQGIEPIRLALMPRPRGGDWLGDEIAGWRNAGVDSVVCLLEAHEVRDLELREEASLCESAGILFRSFPIADRGVPKSVQEFSSLLSEVYAELVGGRSVAIHCRAGIGRTGLVAGCLLKMRGVESSKTFHLLSRSRGLAMPDTSAQEEWVHAFVHSVPPTL